MKVLVRSTTQPTYVRVIPVQGTSFLLDEELDDAIAAVRSVGANGARSLTRVFQQPGTPAGQRDDNAAIRALTSWP